MQPHDAPASFEGAPTHRLLKVVDGLSFALSDAPPERCAWLASKPDSAVPDLPWGAVLSGPGGPADAVVSAREADVDVPGTRRRNTGSSLRVRLAHAAAAAPGDVIELLPQRGRIRTRYRRGANANTLFATERCNSYCLMCSQPPRQVDDDWRVQDMLKVVALLDRHTPELGISGGEPTLLGDGLVEVLRACRDRLPDTPIHVLSNGRLFGTTGLAAAVGAVKHPHLTWGVPLYADVASVHDYVVQSAGAFEETMRGLLLMASHGLSIEIRVVLTAPTVARLPALAEFLYRHVPSAVHVAFMGLEPIGFALANRDPLWIDPDDMKGPLTQAVHHLANRGMTVSLYNLPLCVLPSELRPFARRSISDWKQRYLDACAGCAARSACAGFFEWVKPGWLPRGIRPLNETEVVEA
ncbi:His-Xaa-Ser system radical SAM maturase HxsC [Tahibacter harae]|uniref:His-Xaa-Ser system radical SAM maturase HxsC n=1 Tax=Tahibacter harae TaxID=2963937 RepID=A0ABT1QP45_9GAMM|nr:His-Xaa-Ser system radical SAM maturase HxsC [Tahibacter harae]MCQ4163847.1 His-Xaa-Ser system radical SAM maturase HxsC [Tahibacter harae]